MARLFLYKRGGKINWWIGDYPTGRKRRPTGLQGLKAEVLAQRVLVTEQKTLDATVGVIQQAGPLTLERWATEWLGLLEKGGGKRPAYGQYKTRLRLHILPLIGKKLLIDVVRDDILFVLGALEGKRAHRTRRNIYRTMKMMFKRAISKRLIVYNPCLDFEAEYPKRVPKNIDQSPIWRPEAMFTHREAEMLMFDERIPLDRRVLYALIFTLGVRQGEVLALPVELFDPTSVPLAKMTIAWTYSTEEKITKRLKGWDENSGLAREVPVHPVLREFLETEWLGENGGRARFVTRYCPGQDAGLMVPSREGGNRNRSAVLEALKRDLVTLRLRERRMHDSRRTFVTLCRVDGADRDMLKRITHARPKKDAFDSYEDVLWGSLCKELCKLKLECPVRIPVTDTYTSPYTSENRRLYPVVSTPPTSFPWTAGSLSQPKSTSVSQGHSSEINGLADGGLGHPASFEAKPSTGVSGTYTEKGVANTHPSCITPHESVIFTTLADVEKDVTLAVGGDQMNADDERSLAQWHEDLARKVAAAVLSHSLNTGLVAFYKKIKDQPIGDAWVQQGKRLLDEMVRRKPSNGKA